jgi:hypothetical protein
MKNRNKTLYSLNVEDVQSVAQEILRRNLSHKEIIFVEETLGDYIDWREAVEYAIDKKLYRRREKK